MAGTKEGSKQAVKREAESFKSVACQILHNLSHPGKLSFAVATGLSLIGTLLLALGVFDPLCRVPTPAQITHFTVTKNPLSSYSAVVKPGDCRGSLTECAEERGTFQPNIATGCEAAFNFTGAADRWLGIADSQSLTGSLVVDCNSTNAKLSTLDLCVSRVDPSVYVLFPYPGSPGVKVAERWDDFMPVMLTLSILLSMRMALLSMTLLWLLGLLMDTFTAKPPPLAATSNHDDSSAVSREPGEISPTAERQTGARATAVGQTAPYKG